MSYLPWYKSFWKVVVVLVSIAVLLTALAFALLVFQEVQRIETGAVSEFSNQNNSTATADNTNGLTFTPVIGDDPYIGDPKAAVTIIAFEDFQCPFCKAANPIIKATLQQYPTDVVFVYKDFPLESLHPQSLSAALAAACADEQGLYWEYHDVLFENQEEFARVGTFSDLAEEVGMDVTKFQACFSEKRYLDAVQQDINEGALAGVKVTPTYFVNGTKLEGLLSQQQWTEIIESVLASN